MPPLITYDEALTLGELEDHAEIEALIERAWRVERFGDSTNMCSLVNRKKESVPPRPDGAENAGMPEIQHAPARASRRAA